MSKIRAGRVGEQIKKELSQLIQTGLKDPRVGFVTVTGVDVTNDLSQAKVYLSVFGDEAQQSDSLKAIEKAGASSARRSARRSASVTPRS